MVQEANPSVLTGLRLTDYEVVLSITFESLTQELWKGRRHNYHNGEPESSPLNAQARSYAYAVTHPPTTEVTIAVLHTTLALM